MICEGRQVRVQITETTLARLLAGGQLCAGVMLCLDEESKACLRQLCLNSWVRRTIHPPG